MNNRRTVTQHETAIRDFPLTDVLTVVTTRSLSANGFDEMDAVLEHMTGIEMGHIQRAGALEMCKAELLRQHPQLQQVDATSLKPSNWQEWLAAQHSALGVQALTIRSIKMSAKKIGLMAKRDARRLNGAKGRFPVRRHY